MELIRALAVQHVKKKEQIEYLAYSILMIKIHCISTYFQHFSFF